MKSRIIYYILFAFIGLSVFSGCNTIKSEENIAPAYEPHNSEIEYEIIKGSDGVSVTIRAIFVPTGEVLDEKPFEIFGASIVDTGTTTVLNGFSVNYAAYVTDAGGEYYGTTFFAYAYVDYPYADAHIVELGTIVAPVP